MDAMLASKIGKSGRNQEKGCVDGGGGGGGGGLGLTQLVR